MSNLLSEKCLCCDGTNFKNFSSTSYMELPVYQCQRCKLLISGNDENEMKKKAKQVYEKEYWDKQESEKAIKSNYSDERSLILKKRWESQIDYCKPQIISKKNSFRNWLWRRSSIIFIQKKWICGNGNRA